MTYSTSKWPFSREYSPTASYVDKFPYLNDVPFSYIDSEIGILIWANAPRLLKPKLIVDRGDDEPYVTLHKLGWALNVPVTTGKSKTMCHGIKLEGETLERKIDNLFAQDFRGCQDEELGPSPEDVLWENSQVYIKTGRRRSFRNKSSFYKPWCKFLTKETKLW